jgi:putative membrane protein
MNNENQITVPDKNEKKIFRIILSVSIVVFLAIIILSRLPKSDHIPSFVPFLPKLNAILNGTCSILLITSLYFIKQKRIAIHKKLNITAFVLSSVFLVSYITFHSFGVETKFPADNSLRPVYLFILITHIFLAAIVLPLVLVSFYFGLTMQVKKHRRITRWSFPVWLYVTVTGVIVYLMISPYYKF